MANQKAFRRIRFKSPHICRVCMKDCTNAQGLGVHMARMHETALPEVKLADSNVLEEEEMEQTENFSPIPNTTKPSGLDELDRAIIAVDNELQRLTTRLEALKKARELFS